MTHTKIKTKIINIILVKDKKNNQKWCHRLLLIIINQINNKIKCSTINKF
jgi:hypothetical protein